MKKMKMNKRGFTLIELIIVIVVIGILAGMALPKFLGVQRDAKAANLRNDCDVIQTVAVLSETNRDETSTYGVYGTSASATATAVTSGSDLEKAIIQAGGTAGDQFTKLDTTVIGGQLSKTVKTGTLDDYAVMTSGKLTGTVVYLGASADEATGIKDGKGNEYFGVEAYVPAV